MCSVTFWAKIKRMLCRHCILCCLFLASFVVMYFCYDGNGIIIVCWSSKNIEFVNTTLSTLAGGYICSFIFFVLTILIPKENKARPILDMAKEEIIYAKDTIGGFFMDNGGVFDVNDMNICQIIKCLAKNTDNDMFSIMEKETEWCELLKILSQVESNLHFIQTLSDYLDDDNLERLNRIMKCWRKSYYLLNDKKIDYARLYADIDEETMRNDTRRRELIVNEKDLEILATNIKDLFLLLQELQAHL